MNRPEQKFFNRISYKHIIIGMWVMVGFGLIAVMSVFVHVSRTKMPDIGELENPKFEESTIVYSDDLVEIDRYFKRNRQWIRFDDMSPHLVDALMATEDHRYYQHSGIDAKGTGRAIAFVGARGGASTITQQLALQFFTDKRSSFFIHRVWQKMKEWVIAVEFERRFTKEEIIAMYLNKFEFTNQAYGVGAAAKIYFGKDQKNLTLSEAAVLIGMLNNPVYYNPVSSPNRSQKRRNLVLFQMKKHKFITNEEYTVYKEMPINMAHFNKGANFDGLAPHFMTELKKEVKTILKENNITKPGGISFNLDTDGLEIYTTIDSRYQKHAEQAAHEHITEQQKTFERVWKNKDPWTYIDKEKDLTDSEKENQIKIRENTLMSLLRQTDRYKNLRYSFLDDIIKSITEDIPDTRLWSGDIHRLLKAEGDKSYLDDLIKRKYISSDQKDVYLEILDTDKWNILKSKWQALQSKTKKEFNKKRKMTVYTYSGPIEKEMTPLDSIKYMANHLQIGSISMDPKTGYIKSWIGGSDYNHWKYDHVKSTRQIGSTFKPFVYTAALNNAISPCMKIRDMQYTVPVEQFGISKPWSPKNTRGKFSEEDVTIKEGLRKSLNSISVALLLELGSVDPIVSIAENMGISKERIPSYPSIVLGSPTLSVLEMTGAYCTFANDGISPKPIFIKKIVHKGIVLYKEESQNERVINPSVNYAMVELLKNAARVVSYQLKSEFGGKTGTTNDHVDGWFMGISPNLVTGTWVGGEYNWVRFLSITQGQGGQMARPFFIKYMQLLESDENIVFDSEATFKLPLDRIVVDCEEYQDLRQNSGLSDEIEME